MKVDILKDTAARLDKVWPPPIHFHRKTKGKKAKEDKEEQKSKYRTFDLYFDPEDENSDKYTRKIRIFEEGSAEDWIELRMELEDLFIAGNYETTDQKIGIYRCIFDGKTKDLWRYYFNKRTVENNEAPLGKQLEPEALCARILNDIAKKIFGNQWATAARTQKRYMRRSLSMQNVDPEVFYERLKKMNSYLPYFPCSDVQERPTGLAEDEVIDILDAAKPIDWHVTMLSQGKRPEEFVKPEDLVEYLKQLYSAEKISKALKAGLRKDNDSEDDGKAKRGNKKRKRESESLATTAARYTRRLRPNVGRIRPTRSPNLSRTRRRTSSTSKSSINSQISWPQWRKSDGSPQELKKPRKRPQKAIARQPPIANWKPTL